MPRGFAFGEPAKLTSIETVMKLIVAANAARQAGQMDEAARMSSRIFAELHPEDLKQVLRMTVDFWLGGLKTELPPGDLARVEELCNKGIAAAAAGNLVEGGRWFTEARVATGVNRRVNPALDMLALGAMQAGKLALEDTRREASIKDLIERASSFLATPGKTHEGVALMRQALALVPDPPTSERDRVRAERIRALLEAHDKAPNASAGEAVALPPAAALTHDGWNELGEKLATSSPKDALTCFDRAIAGDPTVAAYWLNKGNALLAAEAPLDRVAEAFEGATRRAPGEIRAWVGLASSLQESERYDAAIEAWNRVVRLAPNAPAATEQRALCSRMAALVQEGTSWGIEGWFTKGMAFLAASEWALARLCFERVLAADGRHLDALLGRGVTLYKWAVRTEAPAAARNRYQLAAASLREALRIDPTNKPAADVLGLCSKALGVSR